MAATTISYGSSIADEREYRLCGDVGGKRVIDLGCTTGNAVEFARLGAKSIAVDPSAERIASVRAQAEAAEVHVQCHQVDRADLGFATSASIDLVVAVGSLSAEEDLNRVFRQVHRVLRTGAAFVMSVPHPLATMLEGGEVVLRRSYWNDEGRTIGGYVTSLTRADFQLDVILEPRPTGVANAMVPPLLILRARKLGV